MKRILLFLVVSTTLFASHDPLGFFHFEKKTPPAPLVPPTPQQAFDRLVLGNSRYMEGHIQRPSLQSLRRMEIHEKQRPFAVIVGCSDSRVPPEIIFDQGLGDLFVVRVAGQVVGPIELDSIEYGVKYLGASLVLVLGHENCGAVGAVLAGQTAAIEEVAALIEPAVAMAHPKTLENAVKANVQYVVEHLKTPQLLVSFEAKEGSM